jgi:arylsulfatase A-like enzyme
MADPNRNIIIILNEDHGQWALSSYGNRDVNTPTLDYLARTGVQMENAFTPIPVCSPSRACLLTGRYPSQHGMHDYLANQDDEVENNPWLENEIFLSQLLSNAGYQVALSGKWHLSNDHLPQAGFEYWFTHSHHYPIEHGGPHIYSDQGDFITLTGYKTQILTDRAISFLRERNPKKPFFLLLSNTASHAPWNRHPERLVDQYRHQTFESISDDVAYPFGKQNLESTFDTRLQPQEAQAQYYAAASQIDEATGRVMDELEANGLRESTLLIFTSDHGLNCGQHGMWGKGNATFPYNMVDESIRIPLIFNQPGYLYQGQRRNEYVDHCDVFQTLVDYAGLELPERGENYYPGLSFLPILNNSGSLEGGDWRNYQICEYGDLRMLRTETHKLILRYHEEGANELFDIKKDCRETVNIYNEKEMQPLVESLTLKMNNFFARYEDPVKSGLNVKQLPRHNKTESWRPVDPSARF